MDGHLIVPGETSVVACRTADEDEMVPDEIIPFTPLSEESEWNGW